MNAGKYGKAFFFTVFVFFLQPFFLNASDNTSLSVRLRPLYEERQITQALDLVSTNSPADFYLRGNLLVELGQKEQAFSNYLRATNDPILSDHAFYKMGTILRPSTNRNIIGYLRRAEKSQNILLKYYAALAMGDFHLQKNEYSKAYHHYQRAYDTLVKMDAPYYRLTDILGNYYKSKNQYLIANCLHKTGNPEAATWLRKVIATGGDARNNKYVVKAAILLTNYPATTYQENISLAKTLIRARLPPKKTRRYLETALQKANSAQNLFTALEILLDMDVEQDKILAEKNIKLYGLYFLNSNQQDGLLYFQGLLANHQKQTQTALSNFRTILENKSKLKKYEDKAIIQIAEISKNRNPDHVKSLLLNNRKTISNTKSLSDFFLRHAISSYYIPKDFTNTLFFLTKLPPEPANLYLRSLIFSQNGNTEMALDNLRYIIRQNTSDYYTLLALRDMQKIIRKDKNLSSEAKQLAILTLNKADFKNDKPPVLNRKFLEALSYDPNFTLTKAQLDLIIRTNIHLSSLTGRTNLLIPERARYCFDRFLDSEGRMELFVANIKGSATYRDLADYFLVQKYPYLQIKYSETMKSILGLTFPIHKIEHPVVRSLFPSWYHTEVTKSAERFKVEPSLIYGIMREESRYRFDARSPIGAMGLMQVMPATFKQIKKNIKMESSNILSPTVNITAGTYYIQTMMNRFKNEIQAAAAYNAGPNAVAKWIAKYSPWDEVSFVELIPYNETRNYVKKVSYSSECYKMLFK